MEADLVVSHVKNYSKLPDMNITCHCIMQKGNVLKKEAVLKRIIKRRRRNKIKDLEQKENDDDDDDDEGYI